MLWTFSSVNEWKHTKEIGSIACLRGRGQRLSQPSGNLSEPVVITCVFVCPGLRTYNWKKLHPKSQETRTESAMIASNAYGLRSIDDVAHIRYPAVDAHDQGMSYINWLIEIPRAAVVPALFEPTSET